MQRLDPIPDSMDLVQNYLAWDVEQIFSHFYCRMQRVIHHKSLNSDTIWRRKYRTVYDKLFFRSKTEMIVLFCNMWRERSNGIVPNKNWTEAGIHRGIVRVWWEEFMNLGEKLFGNDTDFLAIRIYWNVRDLGKRLLRIVRELGKKFHFFEPEPKYSASHIRLAARGTILSLPESEREVLLYGFSQ